MAKAYIYSSTSSNTTLRLVGAFSAGLTPVAAPELSVSGFDADLLDLLFLDFFGSSHPYNGWKLSRTPQSSNKLGYNQNALGKTSNVIM